MIKIAHEPSMPDTQASCDGKNIRKLPMPVSLVLQINRSPTSGEVKICLGSVGGCTSDVIRILNADSGRTSYACRRVSLGSSPFA